MKSKFLKKAAERITPEERALRVKHLEIVSQIHSILERRKITQRRFSEMLNISEAAISKILSAGGNLEMKTIVKFELVLGESILLTPQNVFDRITKK